jgi:hypothetical protein
MMATNQKSGPTPDLQGTKVAAAALAGGALPGADAVGVDKIRDLLFGNQMQDYDRRFVTLEERFLQKFREIESEITRGLSTLETSMKKQLESIATQLREEKDLRTDADRDLERSLRDQTQTLDKRLGQLSDHLARVEREFTERLSKESQDLRDELKHKNEELRVTAAKMFAELGNVKTDRNLLAGLFIEVAKCLNQDFGPKLLAKGGDGEHS